MSEPGHEGARGSGPRVQRDGNLQEGGRAAAGLPPHPQPRGPAPDPLPKRAPRSPRRSGQGSCTGSMARTRAAATRRAAPAPPNEASRAGRCAGSARAPGRPSPRPSPRRQGEAHPGAWGSCRAAPAPAGPRAAQVCGPPPLPSARASAPRGRLPPTAGVRSRELGGDSAPGPPCKLGEGHPPWSAHPGSAPRRAVRVPAAHRGCPGAPTPPLA